ncbi:glycosyltransferase [Haloarculaceae archaeon H-GB11]|nr:glycosyltransferase [Haloarculaceae archaeon H-GB11]
MTDTDGPRVSIVVTAHNYGTYLTDCLDSAIDQTYATDQYEIVVVDDGSTDDTPDILRSYEFEYPDLIRTIRLEGRGSRARVTPESMSPKGNTSSVSTPTTTSTRTF